MITIQPRQLAGPVMFEQGAEQDAKRNWPLIAVTSLAGVSLMVAIYAASKVAPRPARRGRRRGRRR
jgi:predicted exporter